MAHGRWPYPNDISPDASPMSSQDLEDKNYVVIQHATNVVQGNLTVIHGEPRSQQKQRPRRERKPKKPITESTKPLNQDQKEGISKRVGDDWKRLGRRLGFDNALLEQWELEKKPDYTELNYHIITNWEQEKDREATCATLAEILYKKLGRGDLADLLAD
ncbi:uncharacterized protein LOC101852390 [Aplysia californica]|uniref:Uncharacterized protein LOC101852390 n=1 Tax=Aplysia californica TaxID=6500 RepID=A0ABM0JGP9_APLCA|nr:uncharacterized protein LOC101852390 [Aplysia californica]XP_005093292.1 uncharacterized protein LOC101852390 [Aplysia californica]XP_005093293.1 uncharacterized protein LOC101852390 [Aplysia californica]XP_005093294.1 uncharacterized protein LOC101852390 [Aplysia californica]